MSELRHITEAGRLLSAKLITGILQILDRAAPSFFDMFDTEGERLTARINDFIEDAVVDFMNE